MFHHSKKSLKLDPRQFLFEIFKNLETFNKIVSKISIKFTLYIGVRLNKI